MHTWQETETLPLYMHIRKYNLENHELWQYWSISYSAYRWFSLLKLR